jgi:hypothetical protein
MAMTAVRSWLACREWHVGFIDGPLEFGFEDAILWLWRRLVRVRSGPESESEYEISESPLD